MTNSPFSNRNRSSWCISVAMPITCRRLGRLLDLSLTRDDGGDGNDLGNISCGDALFIADTRWSSRFSCSRARYFRGNRDYLSDDGGSAGGSRGLSRDASGRFWTMGNHIRRCWSESSGMLCCFADRKVLTARCFGLTWLPISTGSYR